MPGEISQCALLWLDWGRGICTADLRDHVLPISNADNVEMESQSRKDSNSMKILWQFGVSYVFYEFI